MLLKKMCFIVFPRRSSNAWPPASPQRSVSAANVMGSLVDAPNSWLFDFKFKAWFVSAI